MVELVLWNVYKKRESILYIVIDISTKKKKKKSELIVHILNKAMDKCVFKYFPLLKVGNQKWLISENKFLSNYNIFLW